MTQPPKRYASQVRDEQARRTRRAIVAAAHDLFLAQGYAATTIDGIAEAAHVSRRTVFNSVGGKMALLKLAFDWAIVGDDEPVALPDRPAVKAILAESDPRKALVLWVQTMTEVGARTKPLGEVLTAAADIEPAAAELAADRLARPDVLTDYGLRTLSADHPAFQAHAYHRGAIWPFDSWLGWAGLAALPSGRHLETAERVRSGVLTALDQLGRAPELYAVTPAGALEPIAMSNRVQAWTIGAAHALRAGWTGRPFVVQSRP